MKFLKRIEHYNRIIAYKILKIILNTPQIEIPIRNTNINNILILRYDAIGDMIVTIPMIRLIKTNFPNAKIDIIASKKNYDIAKSEPSINNCYIYDSSLKSFLKLRKLKKNKYDTIISTVFNKKTKAGIIAKNITNKNTLIFAELEEHRKNLYSAFFNAQVNITKERYKKNMLEILCIMASRIFGFNFDENDIDKRIIFNENSKNKALKFLEDYNIKEFFIYNISAAQDFRVLSINKNIEILRFLLRYNKKILILSSKEDVEKLKTIINNLKNSNIIQYPTDSIEDVMAIASKAKFVFTPDTSIVHIASSYDIPSFILFSSRTSLMSDWLPYKTPFESVISENKDSIENIDINIIFYKLDNFLKNQLII